MSIIEYMKLESYGPDWYYITLDIGSDFNYNYV